MSAIGVGVDLVEVSRVAAIIADKGARVFERLLTPAERAYCESRPDGLAAERARTLGVSRVLLSLSHTHQAAVAVVVLDHGS